MVAEEEGIFTSMSGGSHCAGRATTAMAGAGGAVAPFRCWEKLTWHGEKASQADEALPCCGMCGQAAPQTLSQWLLPCPLICEDCAEQKEWAMARKTQTWGRGNNLYVCIERRRRGRTSWWRRQNSACLLFSGARCGQEQPLYGASDKTIPSQHGWEDMGRKKGLSREPTWLLGEVKSILYYVAVMSAIGEGM